MEQRARKKILLVEDEAVIAMAEERSLRNIGYSVLTAFSGDEALGLFRKEEAIDLILMDIDLGGGMDGPTTARSMLRERHLPIVFLSSHTEPQVVERTEAITSYGYVVKNSGITVLDASIKMAFRLYEANRKLRDIERKQETMIANISDVIGILGADGVVKYVSPSIEKRFGWRPADFEGPNAWITVHPEDLPGLKAEFAELLAVDRSTRTVEYRYRCKDGAYKLVRLTATNLLRDPVIAGVLVNYHEISGRLPGGHPAA
jgi:PAS domain S-box-containing protein